MAARICVMGWVHMDLVVRAQELPAAGESVMGEELLIVPGGKGASRAVAAARLGAEVDLIGRVGEDAWGRELRSVLSTEGVGIQRLASARGEPTGASLVTLLPDGRAATMIAHGANATLSVAEVSAAAEELAAADVLMCHLGLPDEVLLEALRLAQRNGTKTLLHTEPKQELSAEVAGAVDLLVASERGGQRLFAHEEELAPGALARRLDALGAGRVGVIRADGGGLSFDGENYLEVDQLEQPSVDASARGAAIAAGLAVGLGEGARAAAGLCFALAAGSLAASLAGALPSLPARDAVEELVKSARA